LVGVKKSEDCPYKLYLLILFHQGVIRRKKQSQQLLDHEITISFIHKIRTYNYFIFYGYSCFFFPFMNIYRKVSSPRVKQYKSGTFKAFSDSLIGYITEGSLKLPSILGKPAANTPKIETELTNEKVQAIVKLVNESAPANALK